MLATVPNDAPCPFGVGSSSGYPVGFSLPEQGCEEAAFRVEQASEQPVRAPVFEPLLGPAAGEPDVEVSELVEHRGAMEQRAAVDWIQLASSDVERGSAGVRVDARTVVGHEVGHEPTQVDLGWAEQGELEVEQGDDVAVPQRVHQREVAVVDDVLDERRSPVVALDDLAEARPLDV